MFRLKPFVLNVIYGKDLLFYVEQQIHVELSETAKNFVPTYVKGMLELILKNFYSALKQVSTLRDDFPRLIALEQEVVQRTEEAGEGERLRRGME